jgi:hypothetical protein
MRLQAGRALRVRIAVATLTLLAGGCHWPWHRHPPQPPQPVHELTITGAGADTYPQFWKRNALLIDLSAASGTGSITLTPPAGMTWPVRLALRVTPGAIGMLEVHGAQRVSLPISQVPAKPIDLELAPAVYPPQDKTLTVQWGPAPRP